MDFSEYQEKARKTAIYPDVGNNFVFPTLGLTGEAGEIANKIKKIPRDDGDELTDEKKAEVSYELGDLLWYVAQLSTELGIDLEDVVKKNLEKISARKSQGTLHGSGDKR